MLLFLMISLSVSLLPAFAEVTSLQADRPLYSSDMEILFSGTVDTYDEGKLVNLMVFNPDGKLVMMTGGTAEPNGTFQISASTNDPSQFGTKGTYFASAFVNFKSDGKTIGFDFSPDGSPVSHLQQTGGATGVKLYETIPEKIAASDLANMSRPPGPLPLLGGQAGVGIADVIYPVMAACGAAIVGVIVYKRTKRAAKPAEPSRETVDESSEPDYAMMILKNRLAKGEISLEEFKATKEALGEP